MKLDGYRAVGVEYNLLFRERRMNENEIRAKASSKTLRKVCNELSRVAGVKPIHSRIPSQDFQAIKEIIDVRMQDTAEVVKMWAERMKKAGLHPRFPRFE